MHKGIWFAPVLGYLICCDESCTTFFTRLKSEINVRVTWELELMRDCTYLRSRQSFFGPSKDFAIFYSLKSNLNWIEKSRRHCCLSFTVIGQSIKIKIHFISSPNHYFICYLLSTRGLCCCFAIERRRLRNRKIFLQNFAVSCVSSLLNGQAMENEMKTAKKNEKKNKKKT